MSDAPNASGHVFKRDGSRGVVWYAKFRLPGGRQVQKRGSRGQAIALRTYRSSVNGHFNPVFGQRRIDEITDRDLERWRNALSVSLPTQAPYRALRHLHAGPEGLIKSDIAMLPSRLRTR